MRHRLSSPPTTPTMPSPAASDLAETHQLPAFYSPRTAPVDAISGHHSDAAAAPVEDLSLSPADATVADTPSSQPPPPSLLSPAFTPPATPGTQTPRTRGPRSVPVDSSIPSGGCGTKKPRLLETLPEVQCLVRARIPTVNGTEMFLHLYTNNVDKKEHLAIVFGKHIRSKSLDAPRDGETEMDRMIRAAWRAASPTRPCRSPRPPRRPRPRSSGSIPSAIPARPPGPRAATAASSSTRPPASWACPITRAAASSSTCGKRAAASASARSSRPTTCKTWAPTRSRRTCSSATRPMPEATAWPRRCCSISGRTACGC
ncbi:GTP cyclohydrolase-2 [Cordyceps javanica]|nr:GTP cyclohydrolase-2 [Cordyceps javanica]